MNADRQFPFSFRADGALANWQVRAGCGLAATDTVSGNSYGCLSVLLSQSFTYDAGGNRTDLGGAPATGNRYSSFNGASFTFDADGNVARKYKAGVYDRNYFWSAVNQLDSTSDGGTTKHYDYNAFGEPVRISTNGATSSYLIWDGDNLLAELDASGNRIADYTYEPGAIDFPVAVSTGATYPTDIQYQEVDELGNVIGTSAFGAVQQSVSYDAWGTPTLSGSTANRLLWKGLIWEGGPTQLYYMRSRWYDPEAGRFVSEDPIGHAGGVNLYAFGGNDPVNASDPAGLDDCMYGAGECLAGVVTISWPYSIPREEGASANFGKLGVRGPTPRTTLGGAEPGAGPAGSPTVSFRSCFDANRFSSLLKGTKLERTATFLEIGAEISLLSDLAAYSKKLGRMGAGGRGVAYASGMNRAFRFLARDALGSKTLHSVLLGIGNLVTYPTAVVGAFSAGYNMEIGVQCAFGGLR